MQRAGTAPGLTYVEIAGGYSHSVALRSDGSAAAWGYISNLPAPPPGLTYVGIAGGYSFTAALLSDGSLMASGSNQYGQCNVPALPAGLTYVEIACGYDHAVARRSDGSVVTWGNNQVPASATFRHCPRASVGSRSRASGRRSRACPTVR